MREFLDIELEYEYSIDNYGRNNAEECLVGYANNGVTINYSAILKFKEDNRLGSIKDTKAILNIYVSGFIGGNVIPIEVINYNTMKSKVFLLSASVINKYSKLDISSIFTIDKNIEFKITALENRKGLVILNNREKNFSPTLNIEYTPCEHLVKNKQFGAIIEEVNSSIKHKKIDMMDNSNDIELYDIVKYLYNYFSDEICQLKEKVKTLEELTEKNEKTELLEPLDIKPVLEEKKLKSEIGCFGFLAIKLLKETSESKVNKVIFSPEILEEVTIDENNESIIIESDGIYTVRYNVEITSMSLAVPILVTKINNNEVGNSTKGIATPHQILSAEVMQKLKAGDKVDLIIKGIYVNTMVSGNFIITRVN